MRRFVGFARLALVWALLLVAAGCNTPAQPSPTTPTTGTSTIAGPIYGGDPFQVTVSPVELVSMASPAGVYSGLCPIEVTFRSSISVDRGPVDVDFLWHRGTGLSYSGPTVHFGGTGAQTQTVTTVWQFGELSTGTLGLSVISPVSVASELLSFTAQCQGAVLADPASSPTTHCGSPFTFHFSASIYTNLPAGTVLHYQWRRSDGAVGPEQTLPTGLAAWSIGVSTTWDIGAKEYVGWQTLVLWWHDVSGDHRVETSTPQVSMHCG
jgi:hypothetical protein